MHIYNECMTGPLESGAADNFDARLTRAAQLPSFLPASLSFAYLH